MYNIVNTLILPKLYTLKVNCIFCEFHINNNINKEQKTMMPHLASPLPSGSSPTHTLFNPDSPGNFPVLPPLLGRTICLPTSGHIQACELSRPISPLPPLPPQPLSTSLSSFPPSMKSNKMDLHKQMQKYIHPGTWLWEKPRTP